MEAEGRVGLEWWSSGEAVDLQNAAVGLQNEAVGS